MLGFVRDVSSRLDRCEVTHVQRSSIDVALARAQHGQFVGTLKSLGVAVISVAALPEQPDGVFVEDAAVVLPEAAVITRPGAVSRQPEVESVAAVLAEHRPVVRIPGPGSLDGGDVLRIGNTLFVGQSGRTNPAGIAALADTVEPFGYEVRPVEVRDCLHLKTACTFVPPHFLAANPAWVDVKAFGDLTVIAVDAKEPFAANTFTLAGTTLVSAAFPKTELRLQKEGISTRRVEISEFHKAEAGLTCLCLLMEPRSVRPAQTATNLRFVHAVKAPRADAYFSPAVVHGGVVYVSGQLPIDTNTGRPVEGELEEQTEQVLRNLGAVLDASGSALAHLIKLTFFIADPKSADRITAVCARTLRGHRPTGFFVQGKLLLPGCLVAADAIAALAER